LTGLVVLAVACCGVLVFCSLRAAFRWSERPGGGGRPPPISLGDSGAPRDSSLRDEPSNVPMATRRVDRLPGDPASYRVTLSFPDPEIVAGPGGGTVSVAGQTGRAAPGMPDLPVFAWAMPGVPNRSMRARVLRSVAGVSVPDVQLAPVPTRDMARDGVEPRAEALVLIPDEAVYSQGVSWPEEIVAVSEAWMGTTKLARVAVYPVQYNAVKRLLSAYRKVEFVLEYVPSAHPETQRGPK